DALPGHEIVERFRRLYEERTGKTFPVTPWDALVECINAVFESWNNERAIAYRKNQDIRGVEGTAVNVQTMFPSEVSGIAFTANPANPYADEIIIESSYGLGEAIVSGMVAPDLFVLDHKTLEIKDRALGKKTHAFASINGIRRRDTEDPAGFSLTDDEVRRIAELAVRVEQYFGFAVDIEWGISGDEIALLQSRAVRGLDVARDIETGRDDEIRRLRRLSAGKRKVWVVHNLSETLTAPTPLTWDIMKRFMSGDGGFGMMYRDLGYRPSEPVATDGFLELICGRIYVDPDRAAELFWGKSPLEYDLDAVVSDPKTIETAPKKLNAQKADPAFLLRAPRLIWTLIRSSARMGRARTEALDRFDEVLPPFLTWVEKKRREDLAAHPTDEVIAELRDRIARVLDDFGKESLKPGFFGGLALSELEKMMTQLMGQPEGRTAVGVLTSGLEGDSTVEQNIMLHHVARGEATLEDFIENYGHRTVGEMELAEPRWHEDPGYLKRMIASYRKRDSRSPTELHGANAERRRAAERELPKTLEHWGGSSMLEEVQGVLKEAQMLLPYREIGKHYLMMGYERIRAAVMELSRRWDLGRDVFFLKLDELGRYESERDALKGEIARRKVRWQSAQRLVHPDIIDSAELDTLGRPRKMEDASEFDAQPLAPGVVEGTMRIVNSPDEADDLPDDCILVCPSTDPGWTALFTNIRGLVVERGGMLSHGAITARDFGIPAVACPEATRLLESALRLRVDGNVGKITVLDGNHDADDTE
ncbi:MAG TPA: PEP/pyruvate-binding domain-containing protein, partial [Planctomycetota bacterium]|nr:PEP/pyruvate-binding domain-containing protein [Planctomycetota bacterium]